MAAPPAAGWQRADLAGSASVLDPKVSARLRRLAAERSPALLREVYDAFIQSAKEYLIAIERAIQGLDAESLRKAAHAFKGASANIGAFKVAECSRELEELAEAKTLEPSADLLPRLKEEFSRVVSELRPIREANTNYEYSHCG